MENKDEQLWRIAKKRAGFKKHLATYIIVNGFLWAMWYATTWGESYHEMVPWPIWSTLGWGVGLAFSYYDAYHGTREDATMKEYQKLKDRENN